MLFNCIFVLLIIFNSKSYASSDFMELPGKGVPNFALTFRPTNKATELPVVQFYAQACVQGTDPVECRSVNDGDAVSQDENLFIQPYTFAAPGYGLNNYTNAMFTGPNSDSYELHDTGYPFITFNSRNLGMNVLSMTGNFTDTNGNELAVVATIHLQTIRTNTDFKVLLKGIAPLADEEFRFKDCAPNEDDCKLSEALFKGGEFLVGDNLVLQAFEDEKINPKPASDIYKWTVQELPTGTPILLEGKVQNFSPSEAGQYEISLSLNGGRAIRKKIRVETEIRVTLPNGAPHFLQGNFSQVFGSTRTRKISSRGCVLTDTANMYRRTITDRQITPLTLDDLYVDEQLYSDDDDLNLPGTVSLQNRLSNVVFNYDVLPSTFSRGELEILARKRQLGVFQVHSPGVSVTADPKDVPYCKLKKITDFDKCHSVLNHFVVLAGIQVAGSSRRLILHDPARDRSIFEEDYPQGFRSYRRLTVVPGPPEYSAIRVITNDSNVSFNSVGMVGGKAVNLEVDQHGNYKRFSEGYVENNFVVDPNEKFPSSLTGNRSLNIPHFHEGAYTVDLSSDVPTSSNVSIEVRGLDGKINYVEKRHLSFTAGEHKTIQFEAKLAGINKGTINIESISTSNYRGDFPKFQILGEFVSDPNSDGIYPLSDGLSISIGPISRSVASSEFRQGNGFVYFVDPKPTANLKAIYLFDDGKFEVRTGGVDLYPAFSGQSIPMTIYSFNDLLAGAIKPQAAHWNGLLDVYLDKVKYASNERAVASISTGLKIKDPELEFFLYGEVDGLRNLVTTLNEGQWELSTPRLATGSHTVTLALYTQNKRLAAEIRSAVGAIESDILAINHDLQQETDPEKIEELQKNKAAMFVRINQLESVVKDSRSKLGASIEKQFHVD